MDYDYAKDRFLALSNSDMLAAALLDPPRSEWNHDQTAVWSIIVRLAMYFAREDGDETEWMSYLPVIKGEDEQGKSRDRATLKASILKDIEDTYQDWHDQEQHRQKWLKEHPGENYSIAPEPVIGIYYLREYFNQAGESLTGGHYPTLGERQKSHLIRTLLRELVKEGKLERSTAYDPVRKRETPAYSPVTSNQEEQEGPEQNVGSPPPKPGITNPADIDKDAYYTVWERHTDGKTWMLDRSYRGIYFTPNTEGVFYVNSPDHVVMPQGENPNEGVAADKTEQPILGLEPGPYNDILREIWDNYHTGKWDDKRIARKDKRRLSRMARLIPLDHNGIQLIDILTTRSGWMGADKILTRRYADDTRRNREIAGARSGGKLAAGIAFVRKGKEGPEVLLVHPTNAGWRGSYGIPKGMVEEDEAPKAAALRETAEEIGIEVPAGKIIGGPFHMTHKGKVVTYWIADGAGMKDRIPKARLQTEEVDWAGFVALGTEAERRTHIGQYQVLQQVAEFYRLWKGK